MKMGLFFGLPDVEAAVVQRPYDELEAAIDALSGGQPCEHGHWPHQGVCGQCGVILRLARAILLPPRQSVRAPKV